MILRLGEEEIAAIAARVADRILAAMPTAPTVAPLLDRKGIAAALGISVAKVDRLVRAKRIPCTRVGDSPRFDAAAVKVALESQPSTPRKPRKRKATAEAVAAS